MGQNANALAATHFQLFWIEGEIQEKAVIVDTIKKLLKAQKTKIKRVCTSISGYSVIIKKINLP